LDLRVQGAGFALWLDAECVAQSPDFADSASLDAAMVALRDALKPQE
jgi:tryptophanyl-tRNA synthetase